MADGIWNAILLVVIITAGCSVAILLGVVLVTVLVTVT
jgi:hypothetical protein